MNYHIRVRRLDQIFSNGSTLDAKVARLVVLYEDLRLEHVGAAEEAIQKLDESGKELRLLYFVRRSIATLSEFAEALRMLDEDLAFANVKQRFDEEARQFWDKSIGFFRRREEYIRRIRNDFGGHFGFPPALFVVNNLSDGPAIVEYAVDRAKGKGGVRFKFASEIVAVSMRRHPIAAVPRDHYRLMFRLALAGFGHSARCVQIVAAYDVWPRFNP